MTSTTLCTCHIDIGINVLLKLPTSVNGLSALSNKVLNDSCNDIETPKLRRNILLSFLYSVVMGLRYSISSPCYFRYINKDFKYCYNSRYRGMGEYLHRSQSSTSSYVIDSELMESKINFGKFEFE